MTAATHSAAIEAPAAKPMLVAERIDTYYGLSHILRGVDFRVMAQETVSLLGRNGMGKTTLLRTLMGLVRPRNGRITLGGTEVGGRRPSVVSRAGLAFVPEDRGVFPNLTVKENLSFIGRGATAVPTGPWSASSRCFPGSPSAATTGAISCRAASRRCSRSAAR